ncbi:MAG: PEP-CTERM sorting domain-containing protein [Planctomycetota bacterium]
MNLSTPINPRKAAWLACGLLALGPITPAFGDETLPFNLLADGSSRWYEWSSTAFAQLDQSRSGDPAADGFFSTSDLDASDGLTPAFGAVTVFPFDEVFEGLGTFTFDSTGDFDGTFNITALDLNFQPFVADDDAFINGLGAGAYQTIISNVSGTVTLDNGKVTGFDNVTADVTFTYPSPLGPISFSGLDALTIDGLDFALNLRDQVTASPLPEQDLQWEITGTFVPEPSSVTILALALTATSLRRRRR